MADYQVPLKDMNFLLYDVFNADKLWQSLPTLAERVDRETAEAILQECAKIVEQEIAPLSRNGGWPLPRSYDAPTSRARRAVARFVVHDG